MKHKLSTTLLVLLFGLWTLSCTQEPVLTVSLDQDQFGTDGGSGTLTLSANNEWQILCQAPWLKFQELKGAPADKVTVRFDVAANETPEDRSAIITITSSTLSQKMTITQRQQDQISAYGPQLISPRAKTLVITVETNTTYTVEVLEGTSWVTHVESKALERHYENFSITENDTYSDRNGRILFKTAGGLVAEVCFTQSQNDAAFMESSADYTFDWQGGELTISAKSNIGCLAHVEQGRWWIHAQDTKALEDYAFTFFLDANMEYESRSGIIQLTDGNQTVFDEITVLQTGKPEPYLSVDTNELRVDTAGGEVDITVSSNVEVVLRPVGVEWVHATLMENDTRLHIVVEENLGYQSRAVCLTLQAPEDNLLAIIYLEQDCYQNLHPVSYTHYNRHTIVPEFSPLADHFGIVYWGDKQTGYYSPGLEHSYSQNPPFTVIIRVQDADEVTFPSIAGISVINFREF